jgi:hypothetical protein
MSDWWKKVRHHLFFASLVQLIAFGAASPFLYAMESFEINAGLSGSWYNPETSGQGFFVDVDPSSNTLFLAWFTHGEAPGEATSAVGFPHSRWYTAQGNYDAESGEATLDLFETEGGIFVNPAPVTSHQVGTLSLTFHDCSNADVEYSFVDDGQQGIIKLSRLTPSEVCEALADTIAP